MEVMETELAPAITRQEEAELYAYLRKNARDAMHYELIAKKIHRAASGYASDGDMEIVRMWMGYIQEEKDARLKLEALSRREVEEEPFAVIRTGKVGNPNYQAFLDTLEQEQLDEIALKANNVEFFSFILRRSAEAEALKKQDDKKNGDAFMGYCRQWADDHLSNRVKKLRGLI